MNFAKALRLGVRSAPITGANIAADGGMARQLISKEPVPMRKPEGDRR